MAEELDVVLGDGTVEVEIGGRKYKASPLRVGDFSKFRAWVKDKRLTSFLKAAETAKLDPDSISKTADKLLSSVPEVKEGKDGEVEVSDSILDEMRTEEGMLHLIFLSIKRLNPHVKEEDLDMTFDELIKVNRVIGSLTGAGLPETEGEEEGGMAARPMKKT